MVNRVRPNVKQEVVDELDDCLLDLGYPEPAVQDAGHGQKVMWLIKEVRSSE